MKVKDCMCSDVWCTTPDSNLQDVARMMGEKNIGSVPVCDSNNNLVGIVTDRDLVLRSMATGKDAKTTPISDVMTSKLYSVTPDTDLEDATNLMSSCQIRRVPVTEQNKVMGILSLGDIARNISVSEEETGKTLENICECDCSKRNAQ